MKTVDQESERRNRDAGSRPQTTSTRAEQRKKNTIYIVVGVFFAALVVAYFTG